MQKAMARVRAELGKDAVLVSSRRVNGLVEVIAASEDKPELLELELNDFSRTETQPELQSVQGEREVLQEQPADVVEDSPSLLEMQAELGRLRKLFEGELAQLVWRDSCTRQPHRMALLTRLKSLGISASLGGKIIDKVLPCNNLESAWTRALQILVKAIKRPLRDPLSEGGIIALVGPTGVGKTTTAAKMAAQFAIRHGRNQVALITTDDFRVGCHEQLVAMGSSLGIPVQVAVNEQEMNRTLDSFSARKLIIIDTAGVNQRLQGLKQKYQTLVGTDRKINPYLVLTATAQASVINDTIRAFSVINPVAGIITKTDENLSLGAVVSGVIRHRLPVAYIGTGQKIPEDLNHASPQYFERAFLQSYKESMKLSRASRAVAV